MSRLFDGVDDQMAYTLTAGTALNDALTALIVCKIAGANGTWMSLLEGERSTGAIGCALGRHPTGNNIYFANTVALVAAGSITSTDGWMIVAVTRTAAAAGNVHKLPIGGSRTTTALGALADGLSLASGTMRIGGNDDPANIYVKAAAFWDGTALATTQLDGILSALTTQSIADLSPTWLVDDSDAFATNLVNPGVMDRTAITGTTDSADNPAGWVSGLGSAGSNALAGTVAASSTAAGTLSVRASLAGTVASATTAAGALAVTAPLAGTVASTSSASGTLAVDKALAGAVASTSTVSGSLSVTAPLAGTAASTSTVAGAVVVGSPLAGSVGATSTASGALSVNASLAGTVASTSTLAGTLTNTASGQNALAGTITGTSTLSGALLVSKPLAGTITGQSSLTGDLSSIVSLSGSIASTSTAAGALVVSHPLAGTITSTSTLAGAVVVLRPLAGQVVATSSITGTLTNQGPVTAVGRLEAGASVSFAEGVGSSRVNESTSGVVALSE